jgi:peroxiredoxin
MLPLGTRAPEFSLPDPQGRMHALRDDAAATVVMFICNHCPFVQHIREELARIGRDFMGRNVAVYAINSNDVDRYPGDSPENMQREAETWGYEFPYLVDTEQSVAKAYAAACTPDLYVFDADRLLVYRGQLDDSRPSNDASIDGKDLRAALDAILAGDAVSERHETPVEKPRRFHGKYGRHHISIAREFSNGLFRTRQWSNQ